ncbi:aldehyde-activating protein [Scytonema sp. UIC 10036]|uniref:GFA family protein n=1 Tax=Scytonema sp. UIC 10036 TaxID=2304196 RepID=UPI0012DAA806|nr:GFA family protein [Scytonema sp. UIC 10036]MUG92055.1 aldehyde-activating protein [Scytonema sp. UIC 10036]
MSTYTGGCACGANRYEINTEPLLMGHCQCKDCQEATGSGHASVLVFPKSGAKLSGSVTEYSTKADSGKTKKLAFCPICGSPLYTFLESMPDVFVVKAGSLDDPTVFQPQMVIYTDSRCTWDYIDPALPSYPKMPSTT